jgi:hypothetical protein
MIGPWLVLFWFVACVGVLVWGVFRLVTRVNPVSVRSLWCPGVRKDVTVEFESHAWEGARVAVTRCSAFSPATAIRCDRLCLQLEASPPAGVPDLAHVDSR